MTKKEETKAMKNESRKSIEEFLFVVNLSTEIIQELVVDPKCYLNQASKEELSKKLQRKLESFYEINKDVLYPESGFILGNHVQVATEIFSNEICLNGVTYKASMSIDEKDEMVNGDEEMDAKFENAREDFLYEKYGTSTPEYFKAKGELSFYELFHQEEFIDDLYQTAKKNLKQLSGKENYLNNFQSIEKQLNELQSDMIDFSKRVPVEFKFWRELILEKTKSIIDDLREENSTQCTQNPDHLSYAFKME